MSNRYTLWGLRIDTDRLHLRIPIPLYVLYDLAAAWDDLLEIILPRLGMPNYAAKLCAILDALTGLPQGMPLLDVDTQGTRVTCAPLHWGGHSE